ncbi:FecR family protein [Mariniblastus fucicola]|uniref:FecR protein n=1 Tax=Mariniblastus fucicola TaxID=980251 RepID=A0A5B9PF26_9BACT|nr:FecR family protein [Mariniblastus fucicola]QEG24864.1 FecR protein [Mariniblastus fucicola]
MSDRFNNETIDEDRLMILVDAALDQSISQSEITELASMLAGNPKAQDLYLSEIETDFLLGELSRHSSQLGNPGNPKKSGDRLFPTVESGSGQSSPFAFKGALGNPFLLCFGSLVLLGLAWLSIASFGNLNYRSDVIAHAKVKSDNAKWFIEETGEAMTSGLCSGDVLRVVEGRLIIKYVNGVSVNLDGPVACELVSPMEVRMLLGSLTAEVPDGCEGFSVEAPRATVVDLGTKFRVNVDPQGGTDVVVYKGEVDVDYRAKPQPTQRLRMGEAVRLDAYGAVSRIESIRNDEFIDPQATPRGVLIEGVRDSYDRDSSLSYYEIVQNGMREDALAFVDREGHEWNGLDKSGMPAYLVGGDYVRTFNNDKADDSIELKLNIAAPCKLYILFDNRLPVASWLKDGFKDTGDDIGLDNGPFFSSGQWHNKGPSGIGPGQSIDDVFSIWVKTIDAPGVVTLGATEAPISEPNMYGIVAVPSE